MSYKEEVAKMRVWIFVILALVSVQVSGRTVTFNRYTVDSLVPKPHGNWAGDIDGTSPPYQLDIFATITVPAQAVWYANSNWGKSWSPRKDVWTTPRDLYNLEIAGADFDENGTVDAVSVDMASANFTVSSLGLSDNLGGGNFTTKIIGTLDGRYKQIRVRDVDADGDTDIVVTVNTPYSQADIGLYWYKNTGGMNFTEHFIGKCNPWKVDCYDGDDGDGHLEMVVSETWHGSGSTTDPCRLILYKNDGFEVFTPIVLDTYGWGGSGVSCAELNNDGKTDIICGDVEKSILYWYKNLGGNSFERDTIDVNCPAIDGIDVGDFEPDGDMDIVAAGRDYWFRWYENDGNGNFTPHTIDTQYKYFDLPYVTYLDGDTCPDIVLTEESSSGHVFAYLNPCDPSGIEETEITPTNTYLKVPSLISSESVNLEYGIEKRGDVRLEVIDITGRTVQVIENSGYKEAGAYKIDWNLIGEPNGIYFLRLEAGNHLPVVKKITVIR